MSLAKSYFNENKVKNWDEWLEFETTFDKPGKQGLVGLLRMKDNKNIKYIFKISQNINYLIEHESSVIEGLSEISWLPHFPLYMGTIKTYVDPKNRKSGNPFDISKTKCKVLANVLICEYISNSCKFYNYIKANDKISNDVLINCIKQVMIAISVAQCKKQFAHYDLHSNNIMMRQCDKDLVLCYVIDETTQITIPTLGHIPAIIDFGFSYIDNMENKPCWPSMGHTEAGYFSDHFDWVQDPKLFLVSVTKEIQLKRKKCETTRNLRNIVKNIFKPLNISWSCGWNKSNKISTSDYVSDMIEPYGEKSVIFTEYLHYSLDIIQTLIDLPFKEKPYKNKISNIYKIFINEWVKIEDQIKSPFFNMYILKEIVNIARSLKASYYKKSEQTKCENEFKTKCLECIDTYAKWFRSSKINFSLMLCSLYMLSNCIEGVYFDATLCLKEKNKATYSNMKVDNTFQIFAALDINFCSNYIYSDKTKVLIVSENQKFVELDNDAIDKLNESHPLTHGSIIYKLSQQ
jgi:hypothetical protein